MAKALWQAQPRKAGTADKPIDWNKRMSDHIAFALLVYTGLHIFVTMKALNDGNHSILPYFALVFLVGAVIPACRLFEKRWEEIVASGAPQDEVRRQSNRDLLVLWVAALGLPMLVTGLVKGVLALI
jgi:hypothetical protein